MLCRKQQHQSFCSLIVLFLFSFCQVAVDRILSIIRYFSRVLTAMVPIAHHPGMLDALIFHLKRPKSSLSKEVLYQANGDMDTLREIQELAYRRLDAAAIM
jgi:hypothetical protein